MKILVATTKPWNINAFAKFRGNDPNWHLATCREAMSIDFLTVLNPDWIFLPHWSWWVKDEIWKRWKCVVFHTAPLPKYRGGSVLQHQIMDGKTVSEICALAIVREFDAGPIYLRRRVDLLGSAQDIFENFALVVHDMMDKIIETDLVPIPQEGEPTVYKKRVPEQSVLPKHGNPYNFIRALDANGYPKAFIEHGDLRLEFNRATTNEDGSVSARVRIIERCGKSSLQET